jgi:hypothetical protein
VDGNAHVVEVEQLHRQEAKPRTPGSGLR